MSAGSKATPPHDPEAEQNVIGSVLLKPAVMEEVAFLEVDDFYTPACAAIYRALHGLWAREAPLELVSLIGILKDQGKLDVAGGVGFIKDLADNVGLASSAPYYARIVADKAQVRRLLAVGQEISERCREPGGEAAILLDWAEGRVCAIGQARRLVEARGAGEVGREIQAELEAIYNDPGRRTFGLPTGFVDLDGLIGGLFRGELGLLASRPSMGKTALALNISRQMAAKLPVLFVSLEMRADALIRRLMAAEVPVRHSSLRQARIPKDIWGQLYVALERIDALKLEIVDAPLGVMGVRSLARRLKGRHGALGLVVVDYVQLLRPAEAPRRRERSREQEISEMARGLKGLAMELDCPVLALSQLNRECEKRPDKRPLLSDLRESGSLEQDADLVMFLYREKYYKPEANDTTELLVRKQRNGQTGMVQLTFDEQFVRFLNNEREDP